MAAEIAQIFALQARVGLHQLTTKELHLTMPRESMARPSYGPYQLPPEEDTPPEAQRRTTNKFSRSTCHEHFTETVAVGDFLSLVSAKFVDAMPPGR